MGEIDCFEDMNEFGRELEDPLEELLQDLFHRLEERPGSNPDDVDRGVGVEDALSGPEDSTLAKRIEIDFKKDDRVDAVRASISRDDDATSPQQGASYRIEIEVETNRQLINLNAVFDSNGLRRVA
ncbi:MAG: hypothetical protein JWM74_227 [Myxococcaceae bacterium]|nr:hypothetical protein [Myxococcaceae bacterium]